MWSEPLHDRFQNLREFKKAVARDLEALLNTRQETLEELPTEFTEVSRSLLAYGLPDFTSLSPSNFNDRSRIQWALEQAITTFEPRLDRVRVILAPLRPHDQTVRFCVEALLQVEPAPEPVTFDAMLHIHTQEYVVRGEN
jgi:type VI secretion system protein ImpF